jgi:hypothetical protein
MPEADMIQERDAALRRASALEAEVAVMQTTIDRLTIKTPREQAMRETIHGQGLSMVAMGKELREKDAKIAALEAEVGRLLWADEQDAAAANDMYAGAMAAQDFIIAKGLWAEFSEAQPHPDEAKCKSGEG